MVDMDFITTILRYLIEVALYTAVQIASFVGVIILIGLLIGILEEKRSRWLTSSIGRKAIYSTAWIGVPVHEIGHAIMCLVFGHKIDEIKLIQFNSNDGTLGYVNHLYDPTNLFHRIGLFFIGIAPIIMGIVFISVTLYFTLPNTFHIWYEAMIGVETPGGVVSSLQTLVVSLFSTENLNNPFFYLFMFLAFCIASHMSLSSADIMGAKSGFITMYILLFLYNLMTQSMGNVELFQVEMFVNQYNLFTLSISMISVLFALVATIIAFIVYRIRIV